MDRFQRVRLLFKEDFNKLIDAKVLLLGVGGVGGFCLDGLYRSGVENVSIVDFDTFEISNQNRQIGSDNLNKIKVEVLQKLYPKIIPIKAKIDEQWIRDFDFSSFDLIIDAIDDLKAKVALATLVNKPLISSMGGAKKVDPTKIKYDSVWKTKGDPLAKKFRHELRKARYNGDFEVVYSDEISKCEGVGSFVAVTGSFGLALCALAIKKLIEIKVD